MKSIPDLKIEVTKNELEASLDMLNCFKHHLPITRKAKSSRTVLYDVYKNISKKVLTQPKKKTNTYSLKLKYHEASFLEEFLRLSLGLEFNHFGNTLMFKLNQKIA